MKNFKWLVVFFIAIIFSCDSDDETIQEITDYEFKPIDSSFLLNEKWYLYKIESDVSVDLNGDGESSKNVLEENDMCFLNDYIVFKPDYSDSSTPDNGLVYTIYNGGNQCDNVFYNAEIFVEVNNTDSSVSSMFFETEPFILGSMCECKTLDGVKGAYSERDLYKKIQGEYSNVQNGELVNYTYTLIAFSVDRP